VGAEVGQTIRSVWDRMDPAVQDERQFNGQSRDIAEVIEDECVLLMKGLPKDLTGAT
jgi:hypothetical protein